MKSTQNPFGPILKFLIFCALGFALPRTAFSAAIPVTADSFTTSKQTVTSVQGKAATLSVSPLQNALVAFDLSQLPSNYSAATVTNARLRIYVSRVSKPGDISVHVCTSAWSETVAGPAPTFDPAPLAVVTQDKLGSKRFVVVDVKTALLGWLGNPATNFGLAIVSNGTTPTARLLLGSKEGPAAGFPAELEVETGNASTNPLNVIAGGEDNVIHPLASYSTIPGGLSNEITGSFSFAAGRRAFVSHTGSFVWADSTNADFSSTADNQFSIRASNGLFIANDAGGAKSVPPGTRYRDNSIVSWGRVTANGILDTNFNVASVTRVSTGRYSITLNASLSSGFTLVPIVTPEIDPDGANNPPVGAANVRIPATNQVAAGNTFEVFMYNGSFALVDNDFQFIVTGR